MLPLRYLSIRLTSLCWVDWWGGLGGCRFISLKGFLLLIPKPFCGCRWDFSTVNNSLRPAGRSSAVLVGSLPFLWQAWCFWVWARLGSICLMEGEQNLALVALQQGEPWAGLSAVLGVAGRGVLGAALTSRVPVPTGAVEQRPHGHRRYLVSPLESLWKKTFL